MPRKCAIVRNSNEPQLDRPIASNWDVEDVVKMRRLRSSSLAPEAATVRIVVCCEWSKATPKSASVNNKVESLVQENRLEAHCAIVRVEE